MAQTHFRAFFYQDLNGQKLKKYEKSSIFRRLSPNHWRDLDASPALPGPARLSVDRDLGSNLYLPHAPLSQYIVNSAQGTNSLKLITFYY